MIRQNRTDLEVKITELHDQTKSYLNEIRELLSAREESVRMDIISYFTYSLNISHDPEQESLCLGSYHVRNKGSEPITNPYLCIKIPADSPFFFSGKYVYEHFKQSLKGAGGWERINEKENKEEYWLKPLEKRSIEPNETISFSDFQIKWSPKQSYAGSITGFTYCDQMQDGMAVMNPINLNGIVRIQGDENE